MKRVDLREAVRTTRSFSSLLSISAVIVWPLKYTSYSTANIMIYTNENKALSLAVHNDMQNKIDSMNQLKQRREGGSGGGKIDPHFVGF